MPKPNAYDRQYLAKDGFNARRRSTTHAMLDAVIDKAVDAGEVQHTTAARVDDPSSYQAFRTRWQGWQEFYNTQLGEPFPEPRRAKPVKSRVIERKQLPGE